MSRRKCRRKHVVLRNRKKSHNQEGGWLGALLKIGTTALRYAPRIATTVARHAPKIARTAVKHIPKLARRHVPKLIKKGITEGVKQGITEGGKKIAEKVYAENARRRSRRRRR